MATIIQKALKKLAEFQHKHTSKMLIITLIFTIIMIYGASQIWIQTDMNKEMPQDLPIFQLNDKVTDAFGGQDVIIIEIKINDQTNDINAVKDIRDPRVFEMLKYLKESLEQEAIVSSTTSPATFSEAANFYPKTLEESKQLITMIPGAEGIYNKDHSITAMYVKSNAGDSEAKIKQITNLIKNKIKDAAIPTGVSLRITGSPVLRNQMVGMLVSDVFITLGGAAFFIFLLLLLMERSLNKSILVFIPLFLGILWTVGMLGLLNIPLSIATVGLGAMIMGLGIEYGVFIVSRYKEEREKGFNQKDSLTRSLPAAGEAITASSLTTIIGFGALVLSTMPMLQHLGTSLALGIFFSIIAALVVNPLFILEEERFEEWFTHKMHDEFVNRKKNLKKRY